MNKFTFIALLFVILACQTNLSHGKNDALVLYMRNKNVSPDLWQGIMKRVRELKKYVELYYKIEVNHFTNNSCSRQSHCREVSLREIFMEQKIEIWAEFGPVWQLLRLVFSYIFHGQKKIQKHCRR